MINTSKLRNGDLCLVDLEFEDGTIIRNVKCCFNHGVFQDVETNEIHGSNVFKFKLLEGEKK